MAWYKISVLLAIRIELPSSMTYAFFFSFRNTMVAHAWLAHTLCIHVVWVIVHLGPERLSVSHPFLTQIIRLRMQVRIVYALIDPRLGV
jgi:hypothetical protein